MIYECSICMLFPRLTSYQRTLLRFCIYNHYQIHVKKIYNKYAELRDFVLGQSQMISTFQRKYPNTLTCWYAVNQATDFYCNKTKRRTEVLKAAEMLEIDLSDFHADYAPAVGTEVDRNEVLHSTTCKLLDTITMSELGIVADSMEEFGTRNIAILNHIRSREKHYTGCWAMRQLKLMQARFRPGMYILGQSFE